MTNNRHEMLVDTSNNMISRHSSSSPNFYFALPHVSSIAHGVSNTQMHPSQNKSVVLCDKSGYHSLPPPQLLCLEHPQVSEKVTDVDKDISKTQENIYRSSKKTIGNSPT